MTSPAQLPGALVAELQSTSWRPMRVLMRVFIAARPPERLPHHTSKVQCLSYLTLCTQLASARDVHGATALCPTPGPLTSAPAGGGTLTFLDPTASCARPNSPWPATTTIFCPEPTAVHIFIDSCASKSRTHTSRPDDEATPVDTALAQARSLRRPRSMSRSAAEPS